MISLNGIKINPLQNQITNISPDNNTENQLDSKKININSTSFIPKSLTNQSTDSVKKTINIKEEDDKLNSKIEDDINNNSNAAPSINSASKSTENKLGLLFQKKAEIVDKQQIPSKEITNKNTQQTQESTVKKSTVEELKSSKPIEIEKIKKTIQVEEIKKKEEKNEDKKEQRKEDKKGEKNEDYITIKSYFKVDEKNQKKDKKLYDLDYLMKFRNVSLK